MVEGAFDRTSSNAFQCFSPEIRDSYDETIEVLKKSLNEVAGKHDIRRNVLSGVKRKPRLGETLQKIFDCWPIKCLQT